MALVFNHVSVYPLLNNYTLVEWELHPSFNVDGPYRYTVQWSRSAAKDGGDWGDLITVDQSTSAAVSVEDDKQYNFSNATQFFIRIKLTFPSGDPELVYYSYPEPSWGSLARVDRLTLREVYRQTCLQFRRRSGSQGLLFKRKTWGNRTTSTVDPDTNEVINAESTIDYGTGFDGGYYHPTPYWVEFASGNTQAIVQGQVGTEADYVETVRVLSWPLPRSNDFWYSCVSGKRYLIKQVQVLSKVRHLPVILRLQLALIPPTDIIYQVPIPDGPAAQEPALNADHWFTNHWFGGHWDENSWI